MNHSGQIRGLAAAVVLASFVASFMVRSSSPTMSMGPQSPFAVDEALRLITIRCPTNVREKVVKTMPEWSHIAGLFRTVKWP